MKRLTKKQFKDALPVIGIVENKEIKGFLEDLEKSGNWGIRGENRKWLSVILFDKIFLA